MTRTANLWAFPQTAEGAPWALPLAAEGDPWALPQAVEGDPGSWALERGQTAVNRLIRRTP
jgi:hypothetical protein